MLDQNIVNPDKPNLSDPEILIVLKNKYIEYKLRLQRHLRNMLKALILLFIVFLFLIGKFFFQQYNKTPDVQEKQTVSPTPTTNVNNIIEKTSLKKKIVFNSDYYFNITLPEGYEWTKTNGGENGKIIDKDGKYLIDLAFVPLGEGDTPQGYTNIDGVSFSTHGMANISCGSGYLEQAEFKPNNHDYNTETILIFTIYPSCKGTSDTTQKVKQVIDSISFSPKLKEAVEGKISAVIKKEELSNYQVVPMN